MGVLLTCSNCSWKTNHPNAPLVLRPAEDSRAEIEDMINAGQVYLCYSTRHDEHTGERMLDLSFNIDDVCELSGDSLAIAGAAASRRTRLRNFQAAFQTLGFARSYKAQAPSTVDTTKGSPSDFVV